MSVYIKSRLDNKSSLFLFCIRGLKIRMSARGWGVVYNLIRQK